MDGKYPREVSVSNEQSVVSFEVYHRVRMQYWISRTGALAMGCVLVVYIVMLAEKPCRELFAAVAVSFGVVLSCVALAAAGEREIRTYGKYVFVFNAMVAMLVNCVAIESLLPTLSLTYCAIIMVAGFLCGMRGGLVTSLVGLLLWVLAQGVATYGLVTAVKVDSWLAPAIVWVIHFGVILFLGVFGMTSTKHLREALIDVTSRLVVANHELEKANDVKSRLLASTSHELRTPLNSIIGFADMILLGAYGRLTKLQKSGLQRIKESSQVLLGLVTDMLDLSSMRSGDVQFEDSCCDIGDLCNVVSGSMELIAHKKGLSFDVVAAKDMPKTIMAQQKYLERVVLNLCDNAIKYTVEGKVSVLIKPEGRESWCIEVCDTGIGISSRDRAHVFDAFYRGESPTVLKRSGVGLGLSIVHEMVARMKGRIDLISEVGKGSTFIVTLPLKLP